MIVEKIIFKKIYIFANIIKISVEKVKEIIIKIIHKYAFRIILLLTEHQKKYILCQKIKIWKN